MKYVTIVCDNCHETFMSEKLWTKEFKMDTGRDECPGCTILHGSNPKWN